MLSVEYSALEKQIMHLLSLGILYRCNVKRNLVVSHMFDNNRDNIIFIEEAENTETKLLIIEVVWKLNSTWTDKK